MGEMHNDFHYETAFSRNIGWLTEAELTCLRNKRIAIAGMGGVGGVHLLTLARLGVGAFTISDLDHFELANFNRQAGANMKTLGQPKVDVLTSMARDINPELDIRIFPEGVNESNIDDFFKDVDLYIDGLDFFVLSARRLVYQRCAELGIPIVVAGPIGMGVSLVNYLPGGMSLNRYFGLDSGSEDEQILRFLIGLSPGMLQRSYLAEPSAVDLPNHRGPSTPMACDFCAGAAATNALKILLGRGDVIVAPRVMQFDAYRNKLAISWRPGGYKNPIQRLMYLIARRQFGTQMQGANNSATYQPASDIERILDLARWAPSGDNTQVWKFAIRSEDELTIYGRHISEDCVYDLQGNASETALGALLETIRIAATSFGRQAEIVRRTEEVYGHPIFDVRLVHDDDIKTDELLPYIKLRSVQRRALSTRELVEREKQMLEAALPAGYRIIWREGFAQRLRMAMLMFRNAGIRLTMPEAYREHVKIIDWRRRYSEDRIPDQALGADPVLTRVMEWALKHWSRVDWLNRYAAGTWLARIEMDLIPGLFCGAHFVIVADATPSSPEDYNRAGSAIQRFWLTATRLGLQMQPETTPLIFNRYLKQSIEFTSKPGIMRTATELSRRLHGMLGADVVDSAVFIGRIGAGKVARARSQRRALDQLLINTEEAKVVGVD